MKTARHSKTQRDCYLRRYIEKKRFLPCQCLFSPWCRTFCCFLQPHPTSGFVPLPVAHQTQTYCTGQEASIKMSYKGSLRHCDTGSVTKCFPHNNDDCGMNRVISLLLEHGVDCPLLDVCLLAVSPGLVREQIHADVRVCAILTAWE